MAIKGTTRSDQIKRLLLRWTDALGYALWFAVGSIIGTIVLSAAAGLGLAGSKYLLFVWGFLLMAYATIALWPTSPEDVGRDPKTTSIPKNPDTTRFQRLVRLLPPLRWLPVLSAREQYSNGAKLFLSSILVLLSSIIMEIGLGI
ncbi:hypothetical protein K0C01_02050 [Salinarchaeum sp. IM2453]|uniref:DUF7555 family protein n=1 Tax=Salinarchaeum sp. IM2453 TaxID=2862870 RepID=UPI001C82F47E|nr:hypothetical protein [Salinarchaeum sp. IM2453]QZA88970.1 hypothetical protein K0C01_02050 [Salinarchaeum sp. IM2453]